MASRTSSAGPRAPAGTLGRYNDRKHLGGDGTVDEFVRRFILELPAGCYAGGGAVDKPNILERSVRDLYTATQHVMVSSSAYEAHGNVVLGMTDVKPMSERNTNPPEAAAASYIEER